MFTKEPTPRARERCGGERRSWRRMFCSQLKTHKRTNARRRSAYLLYQPTGRERAWAGKTNLHSSLPEWDRAAPPMNNFLIFFFPGYLLDGGIYHLRPRMRLTLAAMMPRNGFLIQRLNPNGRAQCDENKIPWYLICVRRLPWWGKRVSGRGVSSWPCLAASWSAPCSSSGSWWPASCTRCRAGGIDSRFSPLSVYTYTNTIYQEVISMPEKATSSIERESI